MFGFFRYIIRFIGEVRGELVKASWPLGSQGAWGQEISRINRLHDGRGDRHALIERLHRVLGFCDGEGRRLAGAVRRDYE